jgi:hypothetical protein
MSDDAHIDDTEDWEGWDEEGSDSRPIRPEPVSAGAVATIVVALTLGAFGLAEGYDYARKWAEAKIPEKSPAVVRVTGRDAVTQRPRCWIYKTKDGDAVGEPLAITDGPCH